MTTADLPGATEHGYQDMVADLLRMSGWKVGHWEQRHGEALWVQYDAGGWPDLTCYHPARGLVWLIEIKTDTGDLSARQEQHADWAEQCESNSDGHVKYLLLRPADWPKFKAFVEAA